MSAVLNELKKKKNMQKNVFLIKLYKQLEIFMRSTHATEIKFNINVLVKRKIYIYVREYEKRFFFSHRASAGAGTKRGSRFCA